MIFKIVLAANVVTALFLAIREEAARRARLGRRAESRKAVRP